jgi:hypothetical protein
VRTIDRMCLCKRRFDTEEAARAEIEVIAKGPQARWHKAPLRSYKCPHGEHWHIAKERAHAAH